MSGRYFVLLEYRRMKLAFKLIVLVFNKQAI